MELFSERLIQKKPTAKDALSAGLILLAAFALSVGFYWLFGMLGLPAGAGIVAVAVLFARRLLFVEYEYTLTNALLDIDIIYDKRRRKALKRYDLRTVSAAGPYRGGDAICFCRDKTASGLYYLKSEENGRCETVVIQPNETMLKAFAHYMGARFTP